LQKIQPEDLERGAGLFVLGEHVTVCARIDLAGALLASNVPNARDGVAVLALTVDSTTTAVVKVGEGVNALVITTNQARNRASREALRASCNVTGAVLTLLGSEAFVPLAVFTILLVIVTVIGFTRRCGWVGRVGRGRGRVAAERVVGPLPVVVALRRGGVTGWLLVRSTAAQSLVPRPVVGAVFAGRRAGRIAWSSAGKTAVLTAPLELAMSTVSCSSEDEGNSQSQEKNARNERHVEK